VSAVDNLEERDLRVTRKVDILSAISNKLHKSSSHSMLYHRLEKNLTESKPIKKSADICLSVNFLGKCVL